MGDFFGQVQQPDWTQINALFNPDAVLQRHNQALASNYAPDAARIQNDTQQQNLDDRASLRGLAGGLATRNPLAIADAAVLPGVGGTNSVNSLANTDAQRLALAQYQLSIPQIPGVNQTNALYQPSGQAAAPAAVGGSGSAVPPGLAQAESGGNQGAVNSEGYSGALQFGTGRMNDLGMYHPAQGENPNGNQWQGTITVPGFAPMTHAQFLANPDAQRMAAEVHFQDIGQQIGQTPGADAFDRNGLAAVAHLGGVAGMQRFVATNGAYNPHDANGTSLQDYYQRFSTGGVPAMQAAFGHPDGPLPANHPARQQIASASATQGMPQTVTDATAPTQPAAASDVQRLLASYRNAQPAPTIATPQAMPGADPEVNYDPDYQGPRSTAIAPGQRYSPDQAVSMAQQDLAGKLDGMSPDDANRAVVARAQTYMSGPAPTLSNAPSGQPATAQPPAPVQPPAPAQTAVSQPAAAPPSASQSAPVQASAPQQPLASASPSLPPGAQLVTKAGLPMMQGEGYALARLADGSIQAVPYGLVPLKTEKTPDALLGIDPRNGNVVTRTPITETGRTQIVETPTGNQLYLNGRQVGGVIPFSGRKEQNEAYTADQKTADALTTAATNAQNTMPRLNEMADLAQQLATGPTADVRAKAQAYLESVGVDPARASSLTGMSSAAAAQMFTKLAISTAGASAKADLGSNNGIQGVDLYRAANPNLELMPDANIRITNMLRVAQQATQDYAQAALQHFGANQTAFLNGKSYVPLTEFNRAWQAQANPQIYAAATGILNGDPYARWAGKLKNPADAMRAAGIAARIEPNVSVPIAGGRTVAASSLLGGQ